MATTSSSSDSRRGILRNLVQNRFPNLPSVSTSFPSSMLRGKSVLTPSTNNAATITCGNSPLNINANVCTNQGYDLDNYSGMNVLYMYIRIQTANKPSQNSIYYYPTSWSVYLSQTLLSASDYSTIITSSNSLTIGPVNSPSGSNSTKVQSFTWSNSTPTFVVGAIGGFNPFTTSSANSPSSIYEVQSSMSSSVSFGEIDTCMPAINENATLYGAFNLSLAPDSQSLPSGGLVVQVIILNDQNFLLNPNFTISLGLLLESPSKGTAVGYNVYYVSGDNCPLALTLSPPNSSYNSSSTVSINAMYLYNQYLAVNLGQFQVPLKLCDSSYAPQSTSISLCPISVSSEGGNITFNPPSVFSSNPAYPNPSSDQNNYGHGFPIVCLTSDNFKESYNSRDYFYGQCGGYGSSTFSYSSIDACINRYKYASIAITIVYILLITILNISIVIPPKKKAAQSGGEQSGSGGGDGGGSLEGQQQQDVRQGGEQNVKQQRGKKNIFIFISLILLLVLSVIQGYLDYNTIRSQLTTKHCNITTTYQDETMIIFTSIFSYIQLILILLNKSRQILINSGSTVSSIISQTPLSSAKKEDKVAETGLLLFLDQIFENIAEFFGNTDIEDSEIIKILQAFMDWLSTIGILLITIIVNVFRSIFNKLQKNLQK